jgi:hypothetical protein
MLVPKRCPELLHRHHLAHFALGALRHKTTLSLFIRLNKIDIHFFWSTGGCFGFYFSGNTGRVGEGIPFSGSDGVGLGLWPDPSLIPVSAVTGDYNYWVGGSDQRKGFAQRLGDDA